MHVNVKAIQYMYVCVRHMERKRERERHGCPSVLGWYVSCPWVHKWDSQKMCMCKNKSESVCLWMRCICVGGWIKFVYVSRNVNKWEEECSIEKNCEWKIFSAVWTKLFYVVVVVVTITDNTSTAVIYLEESVFLPDLHSEFKVSFGFILSGLKVLVEVKVIN